MPGRRPAPRCSNSSPGGSGGDRSPVLSALEIGGNRPFWDAGGPGGRFEFVRVRDSPPGIRPFGGSHGSYESDGSMGSPRGARAVSGFGLPAGLVAVDLTSRGPGVSRRGGGPCPGLAAPASHPFPGRTEICFGGAFTPTLPGASCARGSRVPFSWTVLRKEPPTPQSLERIEIGGHAQGPPRGGRSTRRRDPGNRRISDERPSRLALGGHDRSGFARRRSGGHRWGGGASRLTM